MIWDTCVIGCIVWYAGTPLDPTYVQRNSIAFLMEDPCTQYSQIFEALLPLLHFLQSGGTLPDPSAPAPAPDQATQPKLATAGLAAPSAAPGAAPGLAPMPLPPLAPTPIQLPAPAPAPLTAPVTAPEASPAQP